MPVLTLVMPEGKDLPITVWFIMPNIGPSLFQDFL